MERKPQNLGNHAKFDPTFHFFLAPLAAFTFVYTTYRAVKHPTSDAILVAVLGFTFVVLLVRMRTYCLKVQDRVIRLEERLRMAQLLPESLRSRIPEFTESQLIALRFASDAELPALAERTLKENLTLKQIKESIRDWRPDYFRV